MADDTFIRTIFLLMGIGALLPTSNAAMISREMVAMAEGAPIWAIINRVEVGTLLPTNGAMDHE